MRISSHKNMKLSISQEPLNGRDQICVSWELNEVLNNYVKTSKSQGLQKHFCTKFGQNDLRLDTPTNHSHAHPRTIGGGRVVRRCLVNLQCRGVLRIWIIVGQGPSAPAVVAGGGVWTIFLSSIISLFFHPLSGRRPDIVWNTVSKGR